MDDAPGGWQVTRNRETPNQSVRDRKNEAERDTVERFRMLHRDDRSESG